MSRKWLWAGLAAVVAWWLWKKSRAMAAEGEVQVFSGGAQLLPTATGPTVVSSSAMTSEGC